MSPCVADLTSLINIVERKSDSHYGNSNKIRITCFLAEFLHRQDNSHSWSKLKTCTFSGDVFIKTDNRVENLYWTTTSENTKKAYNDGLIYNAASWDDSQSIAVAQFDLSGNFIRYYGSMSEAARNNNITKTMISFQCRHTSKTKPKKGYYYRYKEEFDKYGFVL